MWVSELPSARPLEVGLPNVWSLPRFAFVFFVWLGQFIPFGSLPSLGICHFNPRSLPLLVFTTFYHRDTIRPTARSDVQLRLDGALGDHLGRLFRYDDKSDRLSDELARELLLGLSRADQRCPSQSVTDLLP